MNKNLFSGNALILALVSFIALNIFVNNTFTSWRLDVTKNDLFTLSDGTINILGKLDEPITLRFYYSEKQLSGIPELKSYGTRVRDILEEYVAHSDGKLQLKIVEPEPFSEAEDQAVSYGLRRLPVSDTGELAYFGLVGANTTDDELNIPFFSPREEISLEYDLTKMIYRLANPTRRLIGVISSMNVMEENSQPPWTIVSQMQEAFELRDLGTSFTEIDGEIDTLLIIHPKDLSPKTLYALDQFMLRGGKALVFVDPLSEIDPTMPDPEQPMVIPKHFSDLPLLFESWGVRLQDAKIAGDPSVSIRATYNSPRGPQSAEYIAWMKLTPANLNQDDFVTNQIKTLNLASSGILEPVEGATTRFTPLIYTSEESMPYERDAIIFVRDPSALLEQFEPGGKRLVLGARVNGMLKTAFPLGRPLDENETAKDGEDKNFLAESTTPASLVIVADTDLLADRFWVQMQSYMGVQVPTAIADNGNFVVNALDNLGGNDDMISLRSREEYSRPFERVNEIRRDAENRFRDRERELQTRLQQTESRIAQLQQQKQKNNALLLSDQQKQEIDSFRSEQLRIRKELRAVQHDLQKNIEQLGTQLKFINIGLIPILIALFAIIMGMRKATRRKSHL